MNPDISDQEEATPATNAVSLFGQSGGVNDFPVLKAFQEYIDAEQAKARKRMFGLSIFFIVLLVVVVVTFTIVMTSIIGRNQALSDRLLDIALREKPAAQPVVNVQPSMPSPVVQPSVESAELVRLREELQREKEARQAEQARRDKEKIESLTAALAKAQQHPASAPVVVTAPAPVVQSATESLELIRLREELRREKEERKAEQEKAKAEKRKEDIEAHRRRLYPDYYAQVDARKSMPPTPAAPARHQQQQAPAPRQAPAPKRQTMQPVSYFDSAAPGEDPELKELLKKNAPSQPASKPVAKPSAKPSPKPVPPKPTPVKPATTAVQQPTVKTETLSIGGTADGGKIPWLIELPQN